MTAWRSVDCFVGSVDLMVVVMALVVSVLSVVWSVFECVAFGCCVLVGWILLVAEWEMVVGVGFWRALSYY